MCHLVAYVDGSSHGSPGPSGIGVIVEDSAGGCIRIAKWIGWQDNNVAEYVALLEALRLGSESAFASCLLGFRRDGAANVRRICLPQSEAVFSALDLSQTGSESGVRDYSHSPGAQPRGQLSCQ